MTSLLKGFSIERDAAGNLVVEFHAAIGIQLIGLALFPFAGTAGYALAGAPLGIPLAIVGASFLGLAALDAALLIWLRSRSRVRVSVDRARSCVLVDTRDGRKELPIRDIEKAEFGSATVLSGKGAAVTRYHLELVLRDGRRVPATTEYYSASPADREKLLEALNHELGVRRAMLS